MEGFNWCHDKNVVTVFSAPNYYMTVLISVSLFFFILDAPLMYQVAYVFLVISNFWKSMKRGMGMVMFFMHSASYFKNRVGSVLGGVASHGAPTTRMTSLASCVLLSIILFWIRVISWFILRILHLMNLIKHQMRSLLRSFSLCWILHYVQQRLQQILCMRMSHVLWPVSFIPITT